VIERYEAVTVGAQDNALVHGDIGLHNLALDPLSDAVNGIFDYDSAAWADRHHDFRYLIFDMDREDMLDSALEVYQSATGLQISRNRVRLYNAACSISFLAFRMGTPPHQKSCGRTLAEDLKWVHSASRRSHDLCDKARWLLLALRHGCYWPTSAELRGT
jgi:aminoglycoside phosphotransferase (APT) family kinase protein